MSESGAARQPAGRGFGIGVALVALVFAGLAANTIRMQVAERATLKHLAALDNRVPGVAVERANASSPTCSSRCWTWEVRSDLADRCITVRSNKDELWIDPKRPEACAPVGYQPSGAMMMVDLFLGVFVLLALLIAVSMLQVSVVGPQED